MCSREELLRQLIEEASVLTDEEVEEVLEYAKREFEAAVEEGKKEKKGKPSRVICWADLFVFVSLIIIKLCDLLYVDLLYSKCYS